MLTPEYYSYCADEVIELYSKLDEEITKDVVRRIMKNGYITPTSKHQIEIEQEAGELYDNILEKVSTYSNSSKEIIKEIFDDAGVKSVKFDNKIYKSSGKTPKSLHMSEGSMKVLEAGIKKTNGAISNLTKTLANTSQKTFIDACSLAELQVTSGAFDYNTAIKNAIDSALTQGPYIQYPSGKIDKVDVAVRRAVQTGVSQTMGEVSLAYAQDMDTDLMEITAHGGARPSHAAWQGKVVSISGKNSKYLSLSSIGYGSGDGFKGYNCRHDWFPFIEGISSRAYNDSELKEYKDKTVSYNGKEMSQYEAEQKQRAMERQIREDKRTIVGYNEAAKYASDPKIRDDLYTKFYEYSQILKINEDKYKDFSKATGLYTDKERMQKRGYDKGVSQKVTQGNKKAKEYDAILGVTTKVGVTINDVGIHVRSRAIVRGEKVENIIDALTNPLDVGKIRSNKSQQLIGEITTVVINVDTGKVVTTWSTSTKKAKKLMERSEK